MEKQTTSISLRGTYTQKWVQQKPKDDTENRKFLLKQKKKMKSIRYFVILIREHWGLCIIYG